MRQDDLPKWGVWLIAAWAVVLAILVFVEMLNLTQAVRLNNVADGSQVQIWLIFILSIFFGLAFASSTYGLWRYQNWGRLLFIWTNLVWSGFNIMALFVPDVIFALGSRHSVVELTTNSLRFAISLFLPLLYLNLPRVKALFYNNP